MIVYFIPGLGFDKRVFRNLKLDGFDVEYIDWIEPISSKEKISAYASRLAIKIVQDPRLIILIGHSFGGLIIQEIAQIKNIDKIILISSVKSRKELPLHFRIIRPLGLYKFFTKSLVMNTFKFWGDRQGYKSKEEKDLFIDMINKQTNKYLRWALGQLSIWAAPRSASLKHVVHIHGDLDKTFPIALIDNPDVTVKNGDHFMVYNHSKTLSQILIQEISKMNHQLV